MKKLLIMVFCMFAAACGSVLDSDKLVQNVDKAATKVENVLKKDGAVVAEKKGDSLKIKVYPNGLPTTTEAGKQGHTRVVVEKQDYASCQYLQYNTVPELIGACDLTLEQGIELFIKRIYYYRITYGLSPAGMLYSAVMSEPIREHNVCGGLLYIDELTYTIVCRPNIFKQKIADDPELLYMYETAIASPVK